MAQCPVRSKMPHMDKAPMGPEDASTEQEGRKRGTRRNKSPATRSGWRGRRALLCEPLDVDHLRASCHTRPASATAAVNAITQRLARGTDRVPQPHWPCIASAASRHHHHTYTLKASCTVRASVAHKSSDAVQAEPPLLKVASSLAHVPAHTDVCESSARATVRGLSSHASASAIHARATHGHLGPAHYAAP